MVDLMLKFAPDKLFEVFAEQYIIENGAEKFHKVANIVRNSEKISSYINVKVINNRIPTFTELQYLMNSHSYFMWAKEETICLGSLGVISNWSGTTFTGFDQDKEDLVTQIMANVIIKSAEIKYNQFNSFFQ